MQRALLRVVAAWVPVLCLAVLSPAAIAADFTVTKTTDSADGDCSAADCSLREAIDAANAAPSDDKINLGAGTYELSRANPGNVTEDLNDTGDLDVAAGSGLLTIVGLGPGSTTIDANDIDRILHLADNRPIVEIAKLTLTGGNPAVNTDALDRDGGAIRLARSDLTLDGVVFRANKAENGGAIAVILASDLNDAAIAARDTAFIDNQAIAGFGGQGGALANAGEGYFLGSGIEFSGNRATGSGGAISQNDRSSLGLIDLNAINNTANSGFGGGFVYNNQSSRLSINGGELVGNAAAGTTDGGAIYANNRSTAVLNGVSIRDGEADNGGALFLNNESHTSIVDSVITGNKATDLDGGALVARNEALASIGRSTITANTATGMGGGIFIYNRPAVVISESTIADNLAQTADPDVGGGGIQIGQTTQGARVDLLESTISGNRAPAGDGGGIAVSDDGPNRLLVQNSTLSGNSAGRSGGGLFLTGALNEATIESATIADNTATGAGGAISNAGAVKALAVSRTVVAGNAGAPGQCAGPIGTHDFNLDSGTSCGFTGSADIQNGNADLIALADNGGPTETQALGPDSQARNAAGLGCPLPTDQRGEARPKEAACDIGAFEADPVPDTTAPTLAIKVVKTKDLQKLKAVITSDEDAALTVSGNARPPKLKRKGSKRARSAARKKLKLPFASRAANAIAGAKSRVKLKLSKRHRRKVVRALAKPKIKKVGAVVKVTATDAAGNATVKKVKFKIRQKKRKRK